MDTKEINLNASLLNNSAEAAPKKKFSGFMINEHESKYRETIPTKIQVKNDLKSRSYTQEEKFGSGGSGTVSKCTIVPSGKNYVKKSMKNQDKAEAKAEAKYEFEINSDLGKKTDEVWENKEVFYMHASGNLIPVLGIDDASVYFAAGPKTTLYDVIQSDGLGNNESKVRALTNLANALAFLHEAGIVHRDLKVENILFDQKTGLLKLIDMGLAVKTKPDISKENQDMESIEDQYTIVQDYCGSWEQYLMLDYEPPNGDQDVESLKHKEWLKDLINITSFPTDVYGLGMILMSILFGKEGDAIVDKSFYNNETYDAKVNIKSRQDFYKNIDENFDQLNDRLPDGSKYTPEQLKGIKMLTKLCLDQDPAKRLTAAQVSAFLELLIAGCSADDSLKLAIEIRPMPSNYISAEELKISKDYDFAGKPIFD